MLQENVTITGHIGMKLMAATYLWNTTVTAWQQLNKPAVRKEAILQASRPMQNKDSLQVSLLFASLCKFGYLIMHSALFKFNIYFTLDLWISVLVYGRNWISAEMCITLGQIKCYLRNERLGHSSCTTSP